jgi:hypothetical protein
MMYSAGLKNFRMALAVRNHFVSERVLSDM